MAEHVIIEGVRIPFWDLVWIFVKATFALIPAGIIIVILSAVFVAFFGALTGVQEASAAVSCP